MIHMGIDQDLAELRAIVLEKLDGIRSRVYLFGSRAKATSGSRSDVDIAILPLDPLPEGTLNSIRDSLEESSLPYYVDIIDLSTVSSAFREKVEKEGKLWKDS